MSKRDGSTPKHEIFAVEYAADHDEERAYVLSGDMWHTPRQPEETQGGRRSRALRQAIWRIDARIDYLETLVGDNQGTSLGLNHTGYLRNCRGIAELKWCRAMLANGGVEPIEWAPELEPSPEAVEVQG